MSIMIQNDAACRRSYTIDILCTAIGIRKDRVDEEHGADTSPEWIDRVSPVSRQMQAQNWDTLCYILPWVPHFGIFVHF